MDAIGTPLTELKGTDIRHKAYQQKLLDILEIEKKVEFGGGLKSRPK